TGVTIGGTASNIRDFALRDVNAAPAVPTVSGLTNLRNLTLQFDNAAMALPTATLTAGGNLYPTAAVASTRTGVRAEPGTTTAAVTAACSYVLLNTQANTLTGAVSVGGTASNLRDFGVRNVTAGATVPTLSGLGNLRNLTLQFDNAAMALPTAILTAGGN